MQVPPRRPHAIMQECPVRSVNIQDPFWKARVDTLSSAGMEIQWQMLEKTHCVNNFRIAGGLLDHAFRVGLFYSDSDLYKWVEAACLLLQIRDNLLLVQHVAEAARVILAAQEPDGYLFTYNTIHFPGRRWHNRQVQHELYCAGHFIEAAVARSEGGNDDLLGGATKLADLIVHDFAGKGLEWTEGHEEIEMALMCLYHHTGTSDYLDMAREFIDRRGHMRHPGWQLVKDFRGAMRDDAVVQKLRRAFEEREGTIVPTINFKDPIASGIDLKTVFRAISTFLSGRYHQQHVPARNQREVVGHAVRQTYYAAGMGDVYLETGDRTLLEALQKMWNNMVGRRMYITGGLGSWGITESFGKDYELPNRAAYSETCSSIGSMLWAWRMTLATGDARFAEVFERQLYNAFLVGMSLDGRSWLYRNPLESVHGIIRAEWFRTPCCPTNFARLLASLGQFGFGIGEKEIWIHQYIGSETPIELPDGRSVQLKLTSGLPWEGKVRVEVAADELNPLVLHLRIPAWATSTRVDLNGEVIPMNIGSLPTFFSIDREWASGDVVNICFDIAPRFVDGDPKVKNNRGKVAILRGPIVYVLEGLDNPGIDLFHLRVARDQGLTEEQQSDFLRGVIAVTGQTSTEKKFTAIPYYAWANRGLAPMRLWLPAK